ncbi:hypothetical protein ABIB25_004192 [Nakamurella sp. UYEF19]|uniref:hypothetical protein n=1 Tax=Nakamurella sp. UYEF19 TaxID=1756392 RepID=UPI003396B5E6
MSTESELEAIPMGPPWSIDVIADLHAGLYSDDVSAQLRLRIAEDASAAAILSALDATVDDLSLLPSPRMPERFALRLDAAIAAESAARSAASRPDQDPKRSGQNTNRSPQEQPGFRPEPGPPRFDQRERQVPTQFQPLMAVPSFTPTPPGQSEPAPGSTSPSGGNVVSLDAARTRRRRWVTGIGVAAAVAIAATITVASLNGSKPGPLSQAGGEPAPAATAAPGSGPNALELVPGQFQDAYKKINGTRSGPLANGITAAGCFAANSIAGQDILGISPVTYRNQQASAIVVAVDATHARIVVVGLSCGVDGAKALLDQETVTR